MVTELDAINSMLSCIGEAPVNSLTDNGLVDATIARQVLGEVSRHIQSKGWSFNTDTRLSLAPTYPLPGYIYVPNNTLTVDASDTSIDLVMREGRLWDKANRTFLFYGPVEVDITYYFPFEDLPAPAQHYITVRAGRVFQDRVVGSDKLSGFNAADEKQALIDLNVYEARTQDASLLHTDFAQSILGWRA